LRSLAWACTGFAAPAATDNTASLRVIARLGFRFEGIARQAELVGSRWLDHALFARLSTDEESESGR
jgi:ribosomal-protein-serine acetyltransferase